MPPVYYESFTIKRFETVGAVPPTAGIIVISAVLVVGLIMLRTEFSAVVVITAVPSI